MSEVTDGIIEVDSDRGREIGFTSDRFHEESYLWKAADGIMVSFIHSKNPGNFRVLAETILKAGLSVAVTTPLGRMQAIVRKAGYVQSWEDDEVLGPVEVWVKTP